MASIRSSSRVTAPTSAKNFFGRYPETAALVADWSDEKIWRLTRGGHDPSKVYAAYAAAVSHKDEPTCILAKTVKGYGMGAAGEATMLAHQSKKMDIEALKHFRDRFKVPLADDQLEDVPFIRFPKGSTEDEYLHKTRKDLGGYLPARRRNHRRLFKSRRCRSSVRSSRARKVGKYRRRWHSCAF